MPGHRFSSFVLDLRLSVCSSNGPEPGVSGMKSVVEIRIAREIGENQMAATHGQRSDAGDPTHLLLVLEDRRIGSGGRALGDEAVEGAIRMAPVVHPRDGLLARIAALGEAYGAFEDTGLGGKVFGGDVRAEAWCGRFHAGRIVGVGASKDGSGPEEIIPCRSQFVRRTQEVEAGHGYRDAGGEQSRASDLNLRRFVLGQPEAVKKLPGSGAVEAEDGPGLVSSGEVFDLYAGEGGVAAQDLTGRPGSFGLGVDQNLPATFQGAQVRLDLPLGAEERSVDTEAWFFGHLVCEYGVEHPYGVLAGEPEHAPAGAIHERRPVHERFVPGEAVVRGVLRHAAFLRLARRHVLELFRVGILHVYILSHEEADKVAKVVVLDVDGTLMDTNYLHTEAWARAFEQVGQRTERAKIHKQIGKGSDLLVPLFVEGEEAQEKANDLHEEIYLNMQEHGVPLPGAKELISSLVERGYDVWFVTSAEDEELEHHKELLEAEGKISGVVNSSDVENAKPAPDIFEEALRRAGSSPDETVSVGDSIWDVEAANEAGVRTVGVLSGGAYDEEALRVAGAVDVYENCAALLDSNFPEED